MRPPAEGVGDGRSGGGGGTGYSLGGGAGGSGDANPTPEELRRRRLAALGALDGTGGGSGSASRLGASAGGGVSSRVGGGAASPQAAAAAAAMDAKPPAAPATTDPRQPKHPQEVGGQEEDNESMEYEYEYDTDPAPLSSSDDDEDDDLKKALALSMENLDHDEKTGSTSGGGVATMSSVGEREKEEVGKASAPAAVEAEIESEGPVNVSEFHSIMWDDAVTTAGDKERWLSQGIATPALIGGANSAASPGGAAVAQPVASAVAGAASSGNSPLDILTASPNCHELWGLTQNHGGPCGVLAAVQAEMLRLLLFGRKRESENNRLGEGRNNAEGSGGVGGGGELFYPSTMDEGCEDGIITEHLVQLALAKSVALILARAAIMNLADEDGGGDDGKKQAPKRKDDGTYVRVVLPSSACSAEEEKGENHHHSYQGLRWDDLAPWGGYASPGGLGGAGGGHRRLVVYSIRMVPTAAVANAADSNTPESKRQKKAKSSLSSSSTSTTSMSREQQTYQLANAVSNFILHGSKSQNVPSLLPYFHQPGGVLLLTLSLVATRGDRAIRSEFDDPSGTRLTSQFGHCSQELINLLLTGQAVSNVFDNTLTLSGALTCRGIQYRPSCGYLSQLESLRYCEVGGYYKSPRFPVWVVGSTSHFTVLFGDERCLRESPSDVLLEKCRRAFKAVDGEENGFIDVTALGRVLKDLDLFGAVGGEDGVRALAASLEVSGAGIVLWDDFWKVSSRLLTGASLQSVLQGDDPQHQGSGGGGGGSGQPPLLLTEHGETGLSSSAIMAGSRAGAAAGPDVHVDLTTSSGVAPTSDEELAKRLEAEWNGTANAGATATTTAMASSDIPKAGGIQRQKTDEEVARELAAQWAAEDAHGGGGGGTRAATVGSGSSITDEGSLLSGGGATAGGGGAHPPSNTVQVTGFDTTAGGVGAAAPTERDVPTTEMDKKVPAGSSIATAPTSNGPTQGNNNRQKFEFEKFGDTFPLYHYNGLRGGTLTSFRVTRLSPEEAVGASIAISAQSSGGGAGAGGGVAGGGGAGGVDPSRSSSGGDLEDVVRTKFPSCMFDWGGNHPPYID